MPSEILQHLFLHMKKGRNIYKILYNNWTISICWTTAESRRSPYKSLLTWSLLAAFTFKSLTFVKLCILWNECGIVGNLHGTCFPESHSVVNEGQESRQIFVLSGHFSILKLAPNQQVWWIKSMVHFHNGSLSQELSKVHLVQELWKNLLVRPEFGILYLNWFL